MDKLVELACEVLKILKSIDTSNRVVSPEAFTGGKDHIDHLDHFLASEGKKCVDSSSSFLRDTIGTRGNSSNHR